MKQRRNPHRIDAHYTKIAREMYEVFPLLSPGTPANVTVFAVDQRRGRAYYSKRVVTLPLWVFKNPRGEGFALYYLAHELAHIADFDAGNRNGNHGPTFMAHFMRLCPVEFQHFEIGYKPRNAVAAGIRRKRVVL